MVEQKNKNQTMGECPNYLQKMKVAKGLTIALTAVIVAGALLSFTGAGVIVAVCAVIASVVICKSCNRSIQRPGELQESQKKDTALDTINKQDNNKDEDKKVDNNEQEKTTETDKKSVGLKEKIGNKIDSGIEGALYKIGDIAVKIPNAITQSLKEAFKGSGGDKAKQDSNAEVLGHSSGNNAPSR